MAKVKIGDTFGGWTVTPPPTPRGGNTYVYCTCKCGTEKFVRADYLLKGVTKSCGCLRAHWTVKHGHSRGNSKLGSLKTPEYATWDAMIQRCTNPKAMFWENYGGRGIRVCDRWRNSFAHFLEDMGNRPDGHSIDRINNDGNYEPSNCRWATTGEQLRNTRRNVSITFNGKTMCMKDWAKELGMSVPVLRNRIRFWTLEKAMTLPVSRKNKRCRR